MDSPSPSVPEPSDIMLRVAWVLNHLYNGNQREMARAVGHSQASLSRIINGIQNPGPKLLAALAALPGVDDTWLYTGKGEPLATTLPSALTHDLDRPVARQLLPGPVSRHRDLLSGERFPVPARFFSESFYWYEVQVGDLILDEASQKVEAGDLLLMETDPRSCRDRSAVVGKRCVVRSFLHRHLPELREYLLVEVGWDPWSRRPTYYPLGIGDRVQIENPTPATPGQDDLEVLRKLDKSFVMTVDDIVAVNLLLVRR